jgi:hypothetical protein
MVGPRLSCQLCIQHDSGILRQRRRVPSRVWQKGCSSLEFNGLVVRDKASQTAIKTPSCEDDEPLMSREVEIYERLSKRGGHEGIPRYYGAVEKGIRLQYAPNGDLWSFRKRQKDSIDGPRRLKWSTQIAEALNANLANFAGSSLDGSELLVGVMNTPVLPCQHRGTSSHSAPLFTR